MAGFRRAGDARELGATARVLTALCGISWHFDASSKQLLSKSDKGNRFQGTSFLSMRQSCAATRHPRRLRSAAFVRRTQ